MSVFSEALDSLLRFFGLRRNQDRNEIAGTPSASVRSRKRYKLFRGDEIQVIDDTQEDKEECSPPVKRSKYIDIPVTVDHAFPRRASWTQTIDLTDDSNEKESPSTGWNLRSQRNGRPIDDDVIIIGDSDLSKSPSRFKNAYKAPKHVRSPKKTIVTSVLKEKPMNGSSFSPPSKFIENRYPRRERKSPNIPSPVDTIDLCSSRSTPSPQSLTDSCSSQKLDGTRRKATMSTTPSHSAYSFLLGSCLANSEGLRPVRKAPNAATSPILTVDLTDEPEDDSEVEFVSSFKSPPPKSKEKSTPQSFRVVPRVSSSQESCSPSMFNNSFEMRLRGKPCVNNDYVDDVERHFKANRIAFEQMKKALNKARERYKEANERNIDELIVQKLRDSIKIYDEVEDELPVEEKAAALPELTPEMLKTVEYAWNQRLNEDETLCSKLKTTIKRRDVLTLKGLQWLNDEVINAYMEMIEIRGEEINIPVHTFNTFFYVSITNRGPESVRRWTRKVDIFSKEIILVPIHLQVHWCMVVVHVKTKRIFFYDSMKSSNTAVLDRVMKYLEFEHMDKKKSPLDSSQWSKECPKDIPQQMNGSDCGVFSCMFGEFSSRKVPFNFSQNDMPYFRKKMTYELVAGKLVT